MAKGKKTANDDRSKAEVAKDLADISRLYLDGHSQRAIVVWIKENRGYTLSLGSVNRDIQKAIAGWMADASRNIDEIKSKDLAKLNAIEQRATVAYERSLKDHEKTHQRQITDDLEQPETDTKEKIGRPRKRIEASVTKETRDGDPRWLQIILDCIKERKEILGYAKPKKIDIGGEAVEKLGVAVETALELAYGKPSITIEVGTETAIPDWQKALKNS